MRHHAFKINQGRSADGALIEWASHVMSRAGVAWLWALARQARGEAVAPLLVATARSGLPGESPPAAAQVRAQAGTALVALDAGRYAALLPGAAEPGLAGGAPDDPLAALCAREREVAALLCEGLSYAQSAKELYVTRSTVAFHLSNAYAKTGTATRHELVQLVRPSPR